MSLEKIDDIKIKIEEMLQDDDQLGISAAASLTCLEVIEQLEADKRELKADINKIMEVLKEAQQSICSEYCYSGHHNTVCDKAEKLIDEWKGGNNE